MTNKKGNVVIETAIAFSITILLVASIVTAIVINRTDILMQRALAKTCYEFSVLTPLSVTSSDFLSTLINAAPDIGENASSEDISQIMSKVMGYDIASGNAITSTALNAVLAGKFEADVVREYIRFNGDSEFFCPDYVEIRFYVDASRCVILVEMNYTLDTLVGEVERRVISGIPFYGDMELFLRGKPVPEYNEDIWGLDNFTRGEAFIEKYGGNLPSTFPVINSWDGSTATSITSINTSSGSYRDMDYFDKRVTDDINQLSSFDGTSVRINGETYTVKSRDIKEKVLIVVIPENCSSKYTDELRSLENYALSQNVRLEVEQYGIA